MPSLQVVDLPQDKPDPTGISQFFTKLGKDYKDKQDRVEIGNLLGQYQQNREDANAWEDLQLGLMKSNVSPTKRLETQAQLNEIQKTIIQKDKALNSQVKKGMQSVEEREKQKQDLIASGMPDYEAEVYLDAPPSVKANIDRAHRELLARGIRTPTGKNQEIPAGKEQPIPGSDLEKPIGKVSPEQAIPEAAVEWPEIHKPPNRTESERVKWENTNEKANSKKLEEVEGKKKVYRDNGILIRSMTKANDSEKLPSGLGKMIIIDPETGDIRPIAQLANQINPETQLYVKNLKQFLKGAKDFFGARVTNFDVSSFMAQLPGLLNSDQGRRLILKQMELVNDLESIHANELDKGIKHYGRNANYIDISKTVDDKVEAKEAGLLNKIDQVVEASNYLNDMNKNPDKFKNSTLMFKDGKFKAVQAQDLEKARIKGWEVY